MSQVRVQFFTILDGELTRENFNATGGAAWTTDPPLTVNSANPSEGIAQMQDGSTVHAEYWRNANNVTFQVTVSQAVGGAVTAAANANQANYSATANVSGTAPNFTVGVSFRSP
jgi:hypothetical protein